MNCRACRQPTASVGCHSHRPRPPPNVCGKTTAGLLGNPAQDLNDICFNQVAPVSLPWLILLLLWVCGPPEEVISKRRSETSGQRPRSSGRRRALVLRSALLESGRNWPSIRIVPFACSHRTCNFACGCERMCRGHGSGRPHLALPSPSLCGCPFSLRVRQRQYCVTRSHVISC
jgi:hypothetical protein